MFIVCKFRPFLVEQQLHMDKPSLSPQHRPGLQQMISNCGGVQEQKQAWGGPSSVLLVPLSKDMRSREAAQKKMGVFAAASGLRLQGDRYPKLSAVCSALPGPGASGTGGPVVPRALRARSSRTDAHIHRGERRLPSTQFYKGGAATSGSVRRLGAERKEGARGRRCPVLWTSRP